MGFSKKQNNQIETFKKLLLKKNQSINLFSRKNPDFQLNFLFDQAFLVGKYLSPILKQVQSPVLDIGSGNGFPGLFLAILYPKNLFCLCERSRKKSEFLKYLLSQVELSNVKVLCKNTEEIKTSFQVILSQAALPIDKMLKLLTKLLSQEGQAFLWKSCSWKKEWPAKSDFLPEIFKSYKIGALEQVLLRVKKSVNSSEV